MANTINVQSLLGFPLILGVCWLISENRRRFPVKLALGAAAVQLVLVLLLFGVPVTRGVLTGVGRAVEGLSASTQTGTQFVFGYLAGGALPFAPKDPSALFVFAFNVLPVILVVCALSALLWHLKLLKWIAEAFGLVFQKTLGLRGPPALAVAATIFMGQVEGPIFIRAYLERLSRSELFLLLTVGMSCISGSTLVAYATILKDVLPNAAAHVLTASLISAPAGVLLARVIVPAAASERLGTTALDETRTYDSAIDAVAHGIGDGLQVVLNVGATLIVFVAFAALADRILTLLPGFAGAPVTVERILGALFSPLAYCIGVPWSQSGAAGKLLGEKMILTEFSAFIDLSRSGGAPLSERSRMIMTYALCGFANVGSVGINVSGFSVLAPSRRSEVLALVWKALIAGFLATCLTAALVAALPESLFNVR